jgi:hypothetical protein
VNDLKRAVEALTYVYAVPPDPEHYVPKSAVLALIAQHAPPDTTLPCKGVCEYDDDPHYHAPPDTLDVERLARAMRRAVPTAYGGEYPEDERAEIERVAHVYAEDAP